MDHMLEPCTIFSKNNNFGAKKTTGLCLKIGMMPSPEGREKGLVDLPKDQGLWCGVGVGTRGRVGRDF